MIEESTLTGSSLAARIIALAEDAPRRTSMARAARALAKPDAARAIVDKVLELARP